MTGKDGCGIIFVQNHVVYLRAPGASNLSRIVGEGESELHCATAHVHCVTKSIGMEKSVDQDE
jgi:hypothetical protein